MCSVTVMSSEGFYRYITIRSSQVQRAYYRGLELWTPEPTKPYFFVGSYNKHPNMGFIGARQKVGFGRLT